MKLDKNTILKEILPALIAENAQVIIYRMSIKDGKYQYISPSSIKIFGHSPKEFYDKPKIIQNIIAPKWKNYFKEKWNDLKKGIMPPTYEYQIIHGKTGELRWLNQRNVLKKDDNGNPIAIEGIVTDITKRKNIENTLYKSEENYKKYIENAPDGIFIVNEKGKYIDANPSACKMVGYSKEELLNLSIGDIKGEKNSKSSKQFFDLMKDGKISNNLNLKKKDGSIIYVALDAIKLSKNKYMAFCKDISKIKNTQIQLKRSEEKFKTIIKNSHPIIFMIDQQGKFLLSEGQMLSTLGLKPGQVVGTSALEMYKDFPDVIKGIKDALNGKTSDGIVKIKVGDKKIYFDIFFSPFKESPDKISACMGMAIDITEKINSMNALKESEERFSNFSRATFEAIVFSEKGVIIDANKQLADMFGSSSSELVGKNIMDFVAQESKDLVLQNIQYSIEKPYEHLAKKKNGTLFPIEVHGKTIYIGKQKIRVTAIRDITKRKIFEEKIKTSNKHLRNVMDSASDIIFSIEKSGNITFWNSSTEFISGFKSNEIVNKNIFDIDVFSNPEELRKIIEDESTFEKTLEIMIYTKNKKKRIINMSISSLENENSQVGYVFIGKDITSSKYKKRIFNYGNSYLFVDSIDSHKTFFDLLNKDRNSLFISRNIPYELKNKLKENKTEILILNKEQLAFEIDLKKIYNKIKENILKNKFNIIFMERIDYLITVCGFESFINLIYDINDLISNNSSLFMLNINTGTLEDKYLNLLKYELITLTEDDSQIEELEYGLLEILELIFMNKNRNLITSFSHIKDEFHISSVTTRKRVLLLKNKGLIEVIKKGRLKILSLTEKANKILEKK